MGASLFKSSAGSSRAIIGMVHLLPLPGSPGFSGDVEAIVAAAVRDAQSLASGGVDAILVENFGDVPFYPGSVPPYVVAHMTAMVRAIRDETDLPIGVNVLRNDGCGALAAAHAGGANFIRVNVLTGARLTDQGIVHGIAHDLLRLRRSLHAQDIRIFADVNVKHSAPLAAMPLEQQVRDLIERGLADALIVTGSGTGEFADADELGAVVKAAGDVEVLVGSGVSASTVEKYQAAAGFIVGSSLKKDGIVSNEVDAQRVRAMMDAVRAMP